VLKIEMREFQAERKEGGVGVSVRVRLSLKLVRQSSGIIVASQSFERVEESPTDAIANVIKAFDEALGGVLKRAVGWTLSEGERDNAAFRNPTAANPT
jgi:cholesterol transport system auxiliary component